VGTHIDDSSESLIRRKSLSTRNGGMMTIVDTDETQDSLRVLKPSITRRVRVTDRLLANNRAFAARSDRKHLDVRPALRLAIVTCMDSRLDVFAALGLEDGQAHVLRNAGGVITDDVIRSLAISQRRLGTEEVALIHHTDCGLELITDDGFRAELHEATGMAPSFAIESFTDVDANVRQSIARVRHSPFLLHRDGVRGFVYDVDTGLLREIE